jgi:uncharacterized Zn-finger protein
MEPSAATIIQVHKLKQREGGIDQDLIPANSQHRYEVRKRDLPLSCPMPGMYLWNSHPKVYLPVETTGEARCPYCGADYFLVADEGRAALR